MIFKKKIVFNKLFFKKYPFQFEKSGPKQKDFESLSSFYPYTPRKKLQ